MHDSVTVHMAATPERVWDLVSDVTRIGRYSPETFEAVWIDGSDRPRGRRALPRTREAKRKGSDLLDDVHGVVLRAGSNLRLRRRRTGQDPPQRVALRHLRRGRRRVRCHRIVLAHADLVAAALLVPLGLGPREDRTARACAPPSSGSATTWRPGGSRGAGALSRLSVARALAVTLTLARRHGEVVEVVRPGPGTVVDTETGAEHRP